MKTIIALALACAAATAPAGRVEEEATARLSPSKDVVPAAGKQVEATRLLRGDAKADETLGPLSAADILMQSRRRGEEAPQFASPGLRGLKFGQTGEDGGGGSDGAEDSEDLITYLEELGVSFDAICCQTPNVGQCSFSQTVKVGIQASVEVSTKFTETVKAETMTDCYHEHVFWSDGALQDVVEQGEESAQGTLKGYTWKRNA